MAQRLPFPPCPVTLQCLYLQLCELLGVDLKLKGQSWFGGFEACFDFESVSLCKDAANENVSFYFKLMLFPILYSVVDGGPEQGIFGADAKDLNISIACTSGGGDMLCICKVYFVVRRSSCYCMYGHRFREGNGKTEETI